MSSKSIFIAGLIAFLIMGGVFIYSFSRDTSPSQVLEHLKPAPTLKPGATSTPTEAPNPLACVPHCSLNEKKAAWNAYRLNPGSKCLVAKDLPPDTLAVSFSQLMDGHKGLERIEHDPVYQCNEELYRF